MRRALHDTLVKKLTPDDFGDDAVGIGIRT